MEKAKYDVFISYRREGGDKYARTIQQALEKLYRVFLDFDELKDGVFDQRIIDAISESPVFLLILSKGALDRCVNEDDWVRQEILQAVKSGCHIVPVTIDDTFEGLPASLPEELRRAVGQHQFSELQMKTLFKASMEQLVRNRIEPYIHSEEIESGAEIHIETDADCDMFRFKKLIKALPPNEDNIVYLKPGKHKIEFVSHEYSDIKKSMLLDIPYENYSDFITVTLLPQIQKKKEEEAAKRKAEEEAKRKAEELRNKEEAERKAEEEARKKEEEARLREEAKQKAEAEARRKAEEGKRKAERSYQKGKEYYDKNDYSHAYPLFLEAAKQDHMIAQAYLGQMNYEGQGGSQDYIEAVKWFRKAAEQGYAYAQNELGFMYYNGQGVNQDYAEAVKWFRKAAEQGYADAQDNLGIMYRDGQGVNQDNAKAVKWFKKAAEQGCAVAQYNLGGRYYSGQGVNQDYAEAVKWYRKAAEQGQAIAQCNLGIMYYNGQGINQDCAEAEKWFRKAAEQGYADAQRNLGVMYENGQGINQDYKEAVKWYRKSAEQGQAIAQYNLGIMCENGKGVQKDRKEAVRWYIKAAEQGYENAKNKLFGMILFKSDNDEVDSLVIEWCIVQANQNNKEALSHLVARCLTDKNYSEAIRWLQKGVDKGYEEMKKLLEGALIMQVKSISDMANKMFDEGDYKEAAKLFIQAIDQCDSYADVQRDFGRLGYLYEHGLGVEENIGEAVRLYEKFAIPLGDTFAQRNLAHLYEIGKGVPQDYFHATSLYKLAAEKGDDIAMCALGQLYENGTYSEKDTTYKEVEIDGITWIGVDNDNWIRDPDYLKALKYYYLSSDNGNEKANDLLHELKEKMGFSDNLCYWNGSYIDESGQIAFERHWIKGENFVDGYALVWEDDKRFGVINTKGEVIMPFTKKWKDPKWVGLGLIRVRKNAFDDYYYLLDKQGSCINKCEYIVSIGDEFVGGFIDAELYRMFGKNKKGKINNKGVFFEE